MKFHILTQKCVEVRGTKTRSVQFPSLNSFFTARKKSVNSYSEIDCKLFVDPFYTFDICEVFASGRQFITLSIFPTYLFIHLFTNGRASPLAHKSENRICKHAHEYSSRWNGNYLKLFEILTVKHYLVFGVYQSVPRVHKRSNIITIVTLQFDTLTIVMLDYSNN